MDKRIISAFDEIAAEQELKTSTKYFLYKKRNRSVTGNTALSKKALATALVCIAVIICVGASVYSIPVSAISLDNNDSYVELGVNCFDKVVKVTCFGNEEAVDCHSLKNKNYKDAVSAMLESSTDEAPILTVSCKNVERGSRMTETIRTCHSSDVQIQHHSESHTPSHEAHSHDLSTGKYNAYLILKQYEPDFTVEEASRLTMKELRERIALHEEEVSVDNSATTTYPTTEHHGEGKGKHHGSELH